MIVADLAARLGVQVDRRTFEDGTRALKRLAEFGRKNVRPWREMGGQIKKTTTLMDVFRFGMRSWKEILVAGFFGKRAIDGLSRFVSSVTGGAGKIKDLSEQTGIATQTLQEYGHAANMSGSSLEGVVGGMRRLSRNAMTAAKGGKVQARAFREAGVDAKALSKGTLSLDDALGKIADKFATMPDDAKKNALAQGLFGQAGVALIPMLNKGRAGLEEFRKEAHELGLVMSDETIKSLDDFDKEMARAKFGWQGLKNDIVVMALPALKKMLGGLREWFKENRELLKQGMSKFLKGLTIALTAVGKVLSVIAKGLAVVAEHWKVTALLVTSLIIAKLIPAIFALKAASLTAAYASAKAWLIAMAPFAKMALVVFGVMLILEDLYVAIRGGDSLLKDVWLGALEEIKEKWVAYVKWYEATMVKLGLMEGENVVSSELKAESEMRSGPRRGLHTGPFGTDLGGWARANANDEAMRQRAMLGLPTVGRHQAGSDAIVDERREDRIGQLRKDVFMENIGVLAPRDATIAEKGYGPHMNVTVSPTITVNATTGASPGDIAQEVNRQQQQFWDEAMRKTKAGLGTRGKP